MTSYLASAHFRNQLRLFPDDFNAWTEAVESAWPSIRIEELDDDRGLPGNQISLLVRDGNFTGEVAWMGHGLQMWLQMMWYLTLARGDTTIILDEPDVYMHPDLQRGLLRMLRGRHAQVIVATHSVEIMSEARPAEIVMVDRARSRSRFANSVKAVQQVIDHLGGVQPLQLARLWTAQRCVFVEGGDFRLLKMLHDTLDPTSVRSLEDIPHMSIGGWGGWRQALGAAMFLENETGDRIKVYCVLDRDYHTASEITAREQEADERGIQLRIWSKKELENYLISPLAITRVVEARLPRGGSPPTVEAVREELDEICERLRDETIDCLATEFLAQDRKGLPAANRAARGVVDLAWRTAEGRWAVVSGKEIVSQLRGWAESEFGAAFGPDDLAAALTGAEIDPELRGVVEAIDLGFDFAP